MVFKSLRKKAGKTQKQISAEIGISQALYSTWENSGTVPVEYDEKLENALGYSAGSMVDEVFFEAAGGVDRYQKFIEFFRAYLSEGEGRYFDDVETGVATGPYAVLADCGFEIPEIPVVSGEPEDDDFGDLGDIVDWKSAESEAFFCANGYLNEFILNHENFMTALDDVHHAGEIDDEDYIFLSNECHAYVWHQLLEGGLDCGPDETAQPFRGVDMRALERLALDFEHIAADAWVNARRLAIAGKNQVNEPTWSVRGLLMAASSDISATVDRGFTAAQRLRKGYAYDPFVAQLQLQVGTLTEMVEALTLKLDRLADPSGMSFSE